MTSPTYNPSLKQVPRSAMAPILPSSGESSILVWLESIGRLRPREDAVEAAPSKGEPDNEEISQLMGTEDNYEDDEDLAVDDD